MINIAIMGHGTVGSGVAEILINKSNHIAKSINDDVNVKYILDLRDFNDLTYSEKFTKEFSDIVNDSEVDIVVEVMGGINPAYNFVKSSLAAGKSVVTSNKELVAAKGAELLKIAKENNVHFMFEASVGGGIPIIRPMARCLAANEILEVKGILNGTTNYILNKMIVDNMDFNTALKLAQDNGFAEKNPASDIEGHDACRKICILASLAFGKHVYPQQVITEGITEISLDDVDYADSFNCVIKLIASTKKLPSGKITASVRPTLVSRECMLSNVDGVFNAVMITGDSVGEVLFYGPGAGKLPTASAVVADVIDCANHKSFPSYIKWCDGEDGYVISHDEKTKLYVYAKSSNFAALNDQFNDLFGDAPCIKNEINGEIAFITNEELESVLQKKINKLSAETKKVMHTLF